MIFTKLERTIDNDYNDKFEALLNLISHTELEQKILKSDASSTIYTFALPPNLNKIIIDIEVIQKNKLFKRYYIESYFVNDLTMLTHKNSIRELYSFISKTINDEKKHREIS